MTSTFRIFIFIVGETDIVKRGIAVMDGIVDYIVSLVCHQIGERSFCTSGKCLPLCARCTGIYSGFLVAALSWIFIGQAEFVRRLTSRKIVVFLALLFALIVESLGERLHLWEYSNVGRFYFGFGGGVGMGFLLLPLCAYFIGYHPSPAAKNAAHRWAIFIILTGVVISLQMVRALLPVLGIVSMVGLLSIYLIFNVAISGAILGLNNKKRSSCTMVLLFSLVLVLFAGEWTLFSYFKTPK